MFPCKRREAVRLHGPDTPPDGWHGSALRPRQHRVPSRLASRCCTCWAAEINHHRFGGLNHRHLFSLFSRLEVQEQGAGRVVSSEDREGRVCSSFSLAQRRLPADHLLTCWTLAHPRTLRGTLPPSPALPLAERPSLHSCPPPPHFLFHPSIHDAQTLQST